jgi:hypothetical protein
MEMSEMLSRRVLLQKPILENLRKEYLFMDMHVHTKYSHDSSTNIKHLLKRAGQLGIGFAVTDHVQAKGAMEAFKQKRIPVIPGIEILAKENKEIIFYFYSPKDLLHFYTKHVQGFKVVNQAPKSIIRRSLMSVRCMRDMETLIDRADNYSCVKCIPHPYAYLHRNSQRFFSRRPKLMKKIDAIEIINSSLSKKQNKKALNWATKVKKAFTAGSDAHVSKHLGKCVVAAKASNTEEFLDAIRKKHGMIMGSEFKRREALKNMLEMNKTKRNKQW